MKQQICVVSIAQVKYEPNHTCELLSQLLFGDLVTVLEENQSVWIKIETIHKETTGWVLKAQFEAVNFDLNTLKIVTNNQIRLQKNNISIPIFAGSYLPNLNEFFLQKNEYQVIKTENNEPIFDKESFLKSFLYAPYFWSGTTYSGIDCSGFSKMYYKQLGIYLPHFASQQIEYGEMVDFLQNVQLGDLAFFVNAENEVNHVGILLSSNEIIHASATNGCVEIDWIDNEGIVNKKTGIRTHLLRAIKRINVIQEK